MFFTDNLIKKSKELIDLATKNNITLVTAESCTGGLLSSLITSISGSSKIFDRGFVTYSNESKNELLGVTTDYLNSFGAVSKEVALEMVKGAVKNSNANLGISTTGITGPKTDKSNKEIGLVFIAIFCKKTSKLIYNKYNFNGNRDEVRHQTISNAINLLINQIKQD